MKELLFESRGKRTPRLTIALVCALFLIIIGVIIFFASGARYDTGPSFSEYSLPGAGSPVLSENSQLVMKLLGLVWIVIGAFLAEMVARMTRCWIKVYRDHIEGQSIRLGVQREVFSLPMGEVSSVAMDERQGIVILHARGARYKVMCVQYQEASHLIQKLLYTQG